MTDCPSREREKPKSLLQRIALGLTLFSLFSLSLLLTLVWFITQFGLQDLAARDLQREAARVDDIISERRSELRDDLESLTNVTQTESFLRYCYHMRDRSFDAIDRKERLEYAQTVFDVAQGFAFDTMWITGHDESVLLAIDVKQSHIYDGIDDRSFLLSDRDNKSEINGLVIHASQGAGNGWVDSFHPKELLFEELCFIKKGEEVVTAIQLPVVAQRFDAEANQRRTFTFGHMYVQVALKDQVLAELKRYGLVELAVESGDASSRYPADAWKKISQSGEVSCVRKIPQIGGSTGFYLRMTSIDSIHSRLQLSMITYISILCSLAFVVMILVSVWWVKRSVWPLQEMADSLGDVLAQDWAMPESAQHTDVSELVVLRNAIQHMRVTIRNQYSDLEQIQARFADLVDNLPGFIEIHNKDQNYILANKQMHGKMGLVNGVLIGRQVPDAIDSGMNWLNPADGLVRHTNGTDARFPGAILDRIEVILFADTQDWERCVISFDISERVRYEQELSEARKIQDIGLLAGGLAHDLNNQLQIVLGHAELLQKTAHTDAVERRVGIIQSCCNHSAGLLSKLMAFARSTPYQKEPLEVARIVADTVELIQPSLLSDQNVHLRVYCNTPAIVHGDASMLQQVFVNIIQNSRDALDAYGRIIVQVALVSRLDNRQPAVCVLVADNGRGIPKEVQDRIFDPFFTTKERGKGTGLGLSACLGTVADHQGILNVFSKEMKGTWCAVVLSLPEQEQARVEPETSSLSVVGEGGLRLLLVDDESMINNMLKEYSSSLGHYPPGLYGFTRGARLV